MTIAALVGWVLGLGLSLAGQAPASRDQPISPAQLKAAIDNLGKFEAPIRTAAARTVRRTPSAQALPALMEAAAGHADGYVRFRALVLLSGFNDPRARESMATALDDPNDRLRTVAYAYFEHNVERGMAARLLKKLDKEDGEFVRPALTRALAAYGDEASVQTVLSGLVARGQDLYRSAVIEALGDYKAAYAVDAISAISKLDGPLQDDAALTLGKIGAPRALETLAGLQQSVPRQTQASVAAAICLLGVNCGSHEGYLINSLKFSDQNVGFQELLRSAAAGLGALAVAGRVESAEALIQIGIPSRDPTRAPVALALATVALRNTPLMLKLLESPDRSADRAKAIALMAEGFDMLEEDLDKERFFALVRRTYWESPENSPRRGLMQNLIGTLDF